MELYFFQIPPTVEDHTVYEAIQKSMRKLGLGKESTLKFWIPHSSTFYRHNLSVSVQNYEEFDS
jgi:hypothetical protein